MSDLYFGNYPVDMTPREAREEVERKAALVSAKHEEMAAVMASVAPTMTNPTELVERLEKLLTESSHGPWSACDHDPEGTVFVDSLDGEQSIAMILSGSPHNQDRADAEFITEAKNSMPDLLATITRLTAERDAAREGLRHIFEHFADRDQAPGHGHGIPGIWDDDTSNGDLAGKPCDWCAKWDAAIRSLGEDGRG